MKASHRIPKLVVAYSTALLALLLVFSMYAQPEFMVTLAQQVWACF